MNDQKSPERLCFTNYKEFVTHVNALKLSAGWSVSIKEELVEFSLSTDDYLLPRYEIYVNISLAIVVRIYGWLLPQNHPLLAAHKCPFKYITPSNFIKSLEEYVICIGIDASNVFNSMNISTHIIPKKCNILDANILRRSC